MLALSLSVLILIAGALIAGALAQPDDTATLYADRYDRATLALATRGASARRSYAAIMRRDPRTGLFAARVQVSGKRPTRLVPGGDLALATVIGAALATLIVVALVQGDASAIGLAGVVALPSGWRAISMGAAPPWYVAPDGAILKLISAEQARVDDRASVRAITVPDDTRRALGCALITRRAARITAERCYDRAVRKG